MGVKSPLSPAAKSRRAGPVLRLAAALYASTAWAAYAAPLLAIVPVVAFDQSFTDNVFLASDNLKPDSITTLSLGGTVVARTPHLEGNVAGTIGYQKFIHANDFDSVAVELGGGGKYQLVKRFLSADANFAVSDELLNDSVTPATTRPSGAARGRIKTFDVGPTLTTEVANYADVVLRARYGEVNIRGIDSAVIPITLANTEFRQLVGRITTGAHIRPYRLVISGEYFKMSQGFLMRNALDSLFVRISNGLEVVGRVGHEKIFDPGITDLSGRIWSAGIIATPGRLSTIRIEYGHRYNKPAWNGVAGITLTPKLSIAAIYLRTLETTQSRLHRTLTELTDQDGELPPGFPSLPAPILLNLISATSLSTDAIFALNWQLSPPGNKLTSGGSGAEGTKVSAGSSLQFAAGYANRRIFVTDTEDRALNVSLRYFRTLNRLTDIVATAGYSKSYPTIVGTTETRGYNVSLLLSHSLSKNVAATVGYNWRTTGIGGGGASITENVITFGLSRKF
jgi:uncharacterized protein (PEP-CTERM system associated)